MLWEQLAKTDLWFSSGNSIICFSLQSSSQKVPNLGLIFIMLFDVPSEQTGYLLLYSKDARPIHIYQRSMPLFFLWRVFLNLNAIWNIQTNILWIFSIRLHLPSIICIVMINNYIKLLSSIQYPSCCRISQSLSTMRHVNHLRDGDVPSQHSNWNRKFFIVSLLMGTGLIIFPLSGFLNFLIWRFMLDHIIVWLLRKYTLYYLSSILVFSGLFDQIIHSTENVDMIGLFKHLHSEVLFTPALLGNLHDLYMLNTLFLLQIMLGLPMLEGTNPASCFPRTAIGYEATCYSRIWSEVWTSPLWYIYDTTTIVD